MIEFAIMELRNTKLSNLLFSYVFLMEFLKNSVSFASNVSNNSACYNETCSRPSLFQPHSPLILCSYLPREFMICDPLLDLHGNDTARSVLGYGCSKFGGTRYEEVQKTPLLCHAIEEIECYGNRTFLADMQPCIKYSGHYFVTTLLYSVLLGFLGVDRFCLGHTGSAVGKLLTLGGLGVWWFVDIILLVLGQLNPEDGSNWNQYY